MIISKVSDSEILAVSEKLPTAPRLLVELSTLLRNPKVDSDEVVALLKQDSFLVAQIIRLANSVSYSPAEPVGSLAHALAHVGFSEVHRLVGVVASSQLADQVMKLYPIEGTKLRLNALFVAVVMEELAQWANERPNSCYTVGLLRTIGIMGLERLAPDDGQIPPFLTSGEKELHVWEQNYWGVTNCEVAEKILIHWKLPHETVSAIRYHQNPGKRHNPIIHLLRLAASAAAERYSAIPGEDAYWNITPETFAKAGLTITSFQHACARAQRTFDRLKIASA